MSKREYQEGDRVILAGLSTSRLNGKGGIIVSLPDSSSNNKDRYGVRVDGARKSVAIKPININPACKTNEGDDKESFIDVSSRVQKGDRVALVGLKSSVYNGKQGVVVTLSDSTNEGRYGIRIDGTIKPIGIKHANIRKTTLGLQKCRDEMISLTDRTEDESLNADQLAMIRTMINTFTTEEQQNKMFGRKIEPMPDFRLELINEGGGIPLGVDSAWANKRLRLAFEQESSLPHMHEIVINMPQYQPDRKDLMKRLGTNHPSKLEWYCTGEPGSIFRSSFIHPPHASCLRYSFSNQSYRKEKLLQGTTHVAVGFVDLGILMAADLDGESTSPLRFIGIDSSAYVVAKTHVIWELIKQTESMATAERDLQIRYIMQVWFSSTWSEGTECAVDLALSSLCSPENRYHSEVRSILEHWQNASTITLEEARNKMKSCKTASRSCIGFLKQKQDRIAIAAYQLTGDFGVQDIPVCGNIILLDCPEGTPPPPVDESVFSALNFTDVMNILKVNRMLTILDAAEKYVLAGITKLALWHKTKRINVELMCAKVETMIDEIASTKAWTISWSNIIDYFDHDKFHQMARACSKHGNTIHFGYSMNWTRDVWGANLIDYAGEHLTEARKHLLDTSTKLEKTAFESFGWDGYFRFPLPQNPINTVAKILEVQHHKAWAEHFFSTARQNGLFCHVANIEPTLFSSPLSCTGDSTIAFTWTYDPDIQLDGRTKV